MEVGGPFKIEYKPPTIAIQGTMGVGEKRSAGRNLGIVLIIACIAAGIILGLRKKARS